jgi:hypothetical protein
MTGGRVTLKSYDAAAIAGIALTCRSRYQTGGGAAVQATRDQKRLIMRRVLCRSLSHTAVRVCESSYRPEPHKSDGDARGTRTGFYRRHDRAANPQSARGVR